MKDTWDRTNAILETLSINLQNIAQIATTSAWKPMKDTIEYDQQTAAVTAYLAATSDYTGANRPTTSHADMLPSGGDTCAGLDIAAPDGTAEVVVTREDGSEGAATYAPSGGKATIYNLSPGATYSYRCMAEDGSLLAGGLVRAKAGVRLLRMPSLRNVRDIGGWTCDGGTVRHGLLLRGSAPESAPAADVAELHDRMRVRLEVDLRGSDEVPYTTSAIGADVDYRNIDTPWYGDGLQRDEHITDYAEAVRTCMRAAAYGTTTYIHCSAGADRTGMICAMLEAALGVSEDDIDRDYELTCLSGSDRRRTRADWTGFMAKMHGAYPSASLTASTIAWLVKTVGVDNALVNRFRANVSTGSAGEVNVARITRQPIDVTSKPGADVYESVAAVGDGLTYLWEYRTSASGAWASFATLGIYNSHESFTINGPAVTASVDGWQVRCTVTDSYGTSDVSETATIHVVTTYHSVSQELSHATSNSSATQCADGYAWAATISPDGAKYLVPSVTVTMGGADVTSTTASRGSDGTWSVSIPSVTGDVSVSASGAMRAGYAASLVASRTDGYALNSSGVDEEYAGYALTGYIPIPDGSTDHVYRIGGDGVTWGASDAYNRIAWYDKDKNVVSRSSATPKIISAAKLDVSDYWPHMVASDDDSAVAFNVRNAAGNAVCENCPTNAAYFRVSARCADGDYLVVTLDKEINMSTTA